MNKFGTCVHFHPRASRAAQDLEVQSDCPSNRLLEPCSRITAARVSNMYSQLADVKGLDNVVVHFYHQMWEKNMLDVCCVLTTYDEYIAMAKTGNECQLSACLLLLGKFAVVVCCAEVLFQPSFFHVVNTLPAEYSRDLMIP